VVSNINAGHLEVVLAKLQWGKDDTGYSLHVNPTSFSSAGLQTTDFLGYLGFQRHDRCNFTSFQRCYCKWVSNDFNVQEFAAAFNAGYGHIGQAHEALEACGFQLRQPEGWGFFSDRSSGRSSHGHDRVAGDGHTAMTIRSMKATEDSRFQFRFTFIDTGTRLSSRIIGRNIYPPRPKSPVSSTILDLRNSIAVLNSISSRAIFVRCGSCRAKTEFGPRITEPSPPTTELTR
jgi:hypothetical protein